MRPEPQEPAAAAAASSPPEAARLRDLTPHQWRSGIAAWLGWLFDGLEMHLYTLVATPLVVSLLAVPDSSNPEVKEKTAWIQAAFLVGWALGGAFFGRVGDRLGRRRALALTVLTYAICTGLCGVAQTWWQLMLFRFVSALGIGGEWAVGATLIAETWPRAWRPWLAAVLQTGVNLGILLATAVVGLLALLPHPPSERHVFFVGVLPAVMVFWIRRKVPESEGWKQAEQGGRRLGVRDLFGPSIRGLTLFTTSVCALTLSGWWLFVFWHPQHLRRLLTLEGTAPSLVTQKVSIAFFAVVVASIAGNFVSAWLARRMGYPRAIALMMGALALDIICAFTVQRPCNELIWFWFPLAGFFSGVFSLFTMYLPPLFPTLLRTTGAGFCYNIGRLAAAAAAILFGFFATVNDFRTALLFSGIPVLVGAILAWSLPPHTRETAF